MILILKSKSFPSLCSCRYLIALNNREGIQADFLRLLGWMPQTTVENFYTMISRLEKVPQQIDQIILLLEQGQAEGIVLHEYSMVRGAYA